MGDTRSLQLVAPIVCVLTACSSAPSSVAGPSTATATISLPDAGPVFDAAPALATCAEVIVQLQDIDCHGGPLLDDLPTSFVPQGLSALPDGYDFDRLPSELLTLVRRRCALAGEYLRDDAFCRDPDRPWPPEPSPTLLDLLHTPYPGIAEIVEPVSDVDAARELAGTPWDGLFRNDRSWTFSAGVVVTRSESDAFVEERSITCRTGQVGRSFGFLSVRLECDTGGPWAPLLGEGPAFKEVLPDPASPVSRSFVASAHRLWIGRAPLSTADAMGFSPGGPQLTAPPEQLTYDKPKIGRPGEVRDDRVILSAQQVGEAWCIHYRHIQGFTMCLDPVDGLVGGDAMLDQWGKVSTVTFGVLREHSYTEPSGEHRPSALLPPEVIPGPGPAVDCSTPVRDTSDDAYQACREWLLDPLGGSRTGVDQGSGVVELTEVGARAIPRDLDAAMNIRSGALAVALMSSFAQNPDVDDATRSRIAAACETTRDAVALFALHGITFGTEFLGDRFGIPDVSGWPGVAGVSDSLARNAVACAVRAARSVPGELLESWSGTRCGNRGVIAGGVCVDGVSVSAPFASSPIDARVPIALGSALTSAHEQLRKRGLELQTVGLIGCFLTRFESGVLKEPSAAAEVIQASQLSRHADGTACDLSRITVDGEELSVEALGKLVKRAATATGEAQFYRRAKLAKRPRSRRQRNLAVLVTLRNALVDAGFVVFSPMTNSSHHDHLHFEAHPALGAEAPPSDWEVEIAGSLRRARGVE